MPHPTYCPNPLCRNHVDPGESWLLPHGVYHTRAFGTVPRFRCTACGRTMGTQTESPQYYAKRPLPLQQLACALTGRSLHEVARIFGVSDAVVRNQVLRLSRQAMAAHIHLLSKMTPRCGVVFDGLRSFVTSQDYPCDITTAVDRASQTILSMVHTTTRRGGTTTDEQKTRMEQKYSRWSPAPGSMTRDISLLVNEISEYLAVRGTSPAEIDTDEHPLYLRAMNRGLMGHFQKTGAVVHHRTSSRQPRTTRNRLFAVNYTDLMLRHREKEHTRETIAFGRHATIQMSRAWIWAWDHNLRREHRVRKVELGVHAEQGVLCRSQVDSLLAEWETRRTRIRGLSVPHSIRTVWMGEVPTPPVRWKGEKTPKHRQFFVPQYAVRDLHQGSVTVPWANVTYRRTNGRCVPPQAAS